MTTTEATLQLKAVIGFGGQVIGGLKWHPDGVHIIFPLGTTIVVKNLVTNSQRFLAGHTDQVSCVAISRDGKFIASGQRTEPGFRAPIIIWDFKAAVADDSPPAAFNSKQAIVHQLVLHKGGIHALDFSYDSCFLASVGSQDDNSLVVWDTNKGEAVCGSPAGSHAALTVAWFNTRNDRILTGGQYHLRTWEFHFDRRRLHPEDIRVGSIKRIFVSVAIDHVDELAYFGTTSGDILEIDISNGRFVRASQHRFSLGVSALSYVSSPTKRDDAMLLAGTGDGAVVQLKAATLETVRASQVLGGVTSLALAAGSSSCYVGTGQGNVYSLNTKTMDITLRSTAHCAGITDVVFPDKTSDLIITAGAGEIRVWHTKKLTEVLRIQVPSVTCNCVAINSEGTAIFGGWSDGKVRAFLPQSGALKYAISDAHADGVTAIAVTHDGHRMVSGGKDGRVRVWNVAGKAQTMELSFKEHKKEVTCLHIASNDDDVVSSSSDGSCLVWSLHRGTRVNALFASTMFRSVRFHPDESQIVTVGSDRKISYWDAADCTAIRVMEGSTEEINALDIDATGSLLASGGLDRLVKVWKYDEGELIATGSGHSGAINKLRISPDGKTVVSVGTEGAIFVWQMEVP